MSTELERAEQERDKILSRSHKKPKEHTGAWWRGECAPECNACKLVEVDTVIKRLREQTRMSDRKRWPTIKSKAEALTYLAQRDGAASEPAPAPSAPPAAPLEKLVGRLRDEQFVPSVNVGELRQLLNRLARAVEAVTELEDRLTLAEKKLREFGQVWEEGKGYVFNGQAEGGDDNARKQAG